MKIVGMRFLKIVLFLHSSYGTQIKMADHDQVLCTLNEINVKQLSWQYSNKSLKLVGNKAV